MIAVKAFFNTHPDGSPVDLETVDWDDINAPICIYGPFESMEKAIDFMENVYPDDDTDVHEMEADDYDIPEGWYVNDPVEWAKQFEDPEGGVTDDYVGTPGGTS